MTRWRQGRRDTRIQDHTKIPDHPAWYSDISLACPSDLIDNRRASQRKHGPGVIPSRGKRRSRPTYNWPGGAVMGEHLHAAIEERFTVLRGRVGFRLSGRESIATR